MRTFSRIAVWAIGGLRAATGVWLLASSQSAAQRWVGDDGVGARYLAGAVGGRDLVIGTGIMWSMFDERDPLPWLMASVVADGVDAATGAGLLSGERRQTTMAVAGGFGLVGAVTALLFRSSSR